MWTKLRIRGVLSAVVGTAIVVSTTGCLDLRSRVVWLCSCEDCRQAPRCAFQRLEPRYCTLCGEPLEAHESSIPADEETSAE